MTPNTVWLTGSASGVGLHLTRAFIRRGDRVVATDVQYEALQSLVASQGWPTEQLLLRRLDVTSASDWQSVYEEILQRGWGLDYLLNVAGYLKPGFIHETDSAEIERHLAVNVKGVMLGSQLAARHMAKQRHGHIINIASLAGIAPVPGIALYSASKFAVRGFSLALAQEMRPYGVQVTVICPDAIQTPMLTLQEDYEEAALTFSGAKALEVTDIEQAVFENALKNHPMEIMLPLQRGLLAKLSSAMPQSSFLLADVLRRRGRKNQERRRQQRYP
jgi:3-oxoacyl-[acyl-carrier protein] reductase